MNWKLQKTGLYPRFNFFHNMRAIWEGKCLQNVIKNHKDQASIMVPYLFNCFVHFNAWTSKQIKSANKHPRNVTDASLVKEKNLYYDACKFIGFGQIFYAEGWVFFTLVTRRDRDVCFLNRNCVVSYPREVDVPNYKKKDVTITSRYYLQIDSPLSLVRNAAERRYFLVLMIKINFWNGNHWLTVWFKYVVYL